MHRVLLAPLALAALAVLPVTARADSCFGAQGIAVVCFDQVTVPPLEEDEIGVCLFTGGEQCTEYSVAVPGVGPWDPPHLTRACTLSACVYCVAGESLLGDCHACESGNCFGVREVACAVMVLTDLSSSCEPEGL